jgi:amino acid adenylation domain-containing protein/non-ribosomal peptide synthase protein (TIGR01720 family)
MAVTKETKPAVADLQSILSTIPAIINECIHDMVERAAQIHPENPALLAHDGVYSHRELSIASSKVADALRSLGAGAESRVGILLEKSAYYPIAMLGVLKSGAAFVPLDVKHPQRRLEQLLEDIGSQILITSSTLSKTIPLRCRGVLLVDELSLDAECPENDKASLNLTSPANAAYIIFTSGSTGKPKGVIVEHAAISTSATLRGKATGLGPTSRVLQYAAHTFDVSVDEIITTLIYGGCVCIPSEVDRFHIAPAMERMRVNYALLTPTSARTINPDEVPSLKTLLLGGELLSQDVNDKWSSRVKLINVYGPTEASIACVMSDRTGMKGAGHVIGRAIGGSCWIVDANDHSKIMLPTNIGELVIGGPILARGYLNDPSKTRTSFITLQLPGRKAVAPLRFYKTGDMASLDDGGSITIYGRKDNQVKVRGHRINVEEIEEALLDHEGIESAVVNFPKKGPGVEQLTVVLSLKSRTRHDTISTPSTQSCLFQAHAIEDSVLSLFYTHLQHRLPSSMIPGRWTQLASLPKTLSAKTDRKSINAWLEEMDTDTYRLIFHGKTSECVDTKFTTPVAVKLGEIWCKVLNLSLNRMRESMSFIQNGGDSITAMELRRLAKDNGIELAIGDILTAPNLQELLNCATSAPEHPTLDTHNYTEMEKTFSLSPSQSLYFDHSPDGNAGFNQSLCVEIRRKISVLHMKRALQHVVEKHPMLRARFFRKKGIWMQTISGDMTDALSFSCLISTNEEDVHLLAASHASKLCIINGPLFHATFIERDTGYPIIHLSAHHLIIDLVSWRIILQDLEYTIKEEDLHATLPFQYWCQIQSEYASTVNPHTVLPFAVPAPDLAFWIPEKTTYDNSYGNALKSTFKLDANVTERLMGVCNDKLGTRPVDIMIGAFYSAFSNTFSGRDCPTVFIESHGRQPWHPSIDISRTVGWFTTAYPLQVPSNVARDLYSAIESAKQRRQATPANGHPYWVCRYLNAEGQKLFNQDRSMEFVFNFAGQYQQLDRADSLFRRISEVGEEDAHADAIRFSLFDISVSLAESQLVISLTYPKFLTRQKCIESLVTKYEEVLGEAAKCPQDPKHLPESQRPTSSLPWAQTPADISQILDSYGVTLDNVETIYSPSDLQQHMLRSQRNDGWYYTVVGNWSVGFDSKPFEEPLDRLQQAWSSVVNRHSSLKTVFLFSPVEQRFVSVVLKSIIPSMIRTRDGACSIDTRRLPSNAIEAGKPPHQMILIEQKGMGVICRLQFSHAIIDATSRSILLQELTDAYAGEDLDTVTGSDYQDYLKQIEFGGAARQMITTPRCIFPTCVVPVLGTERTASLPVQVIFPGLNILEIACHEGCTLSSLVFTAWSFVLSWYAGTDQISFGYVASNRSVNVPNIENAVGLYVNLLTCRATLQDSSKALDIAKVIQRDCANDMSSPHSRADATQHSNNGCAEGIFNTMVNIRTIAETASHTRTRDPHFSLQNFDDPWDVSILMPLDVQT